MQIFQMVLAVFAILGAADKIFGNKLKLGEEFEKGIEAIGSLSLAMIGMIVLAPTLSKILIPVFEPIAGFLHIDRSFAAGFLANDAGGAMVARELSPTVWGKFNGLIVGAMLGVTIVFTIPVFIKTVDKEYHREVLDGIICGTVTMPFGCFVGGLLLGCPLGELILNILPIIIISGAVCMGLILKPEATQGVFEIFGKGVLVLITIGLSAGVFDYLTGIKLIPYMDSIEGAFSSVATIAITLSGVLPLISVLSRLLKKPFKSLGKLFKINEEAVLGFVVSLSNSIPMMTMVPKMDKKGIVLNSAFAVSAAFLLGDHLAFTMAFDESCLLSVIAGKLAGGISAVILAHFYYKRREKHVSVG